MKTIKVNEQDRKIGATLAFIRNRDCNQSQIEFARRFGISRSLLANIESGRTPLSACLGWTICKSLCMHPSWLCAAGNGRFDNVFPFTDQAEIEKFEKMIFASKNGLLRDVWPSISWMVFEVDENFLLKNNLTYYRRDVKSESVKPIMQTLLGRLNKATEKRGQKTELASWLGVPPQRVTDWLSARTEPSGEYTLQLLQWVELQERKK
jgi:transcriptional regulator with XRE-family HTH domain